MSYDRGNKPRWQLVEAWLLLRISNTAYKRIHAYDPWGKIITHYLVPIVFGKRTRVG